MPISGRRYAKPWPGVSIDWGHPLAQGLVSFFVFNETSGVPYDVAAQSQAASSNAAWASSPYGPALSFNGTSQYVGLGAAPRLSLAGPMSVACLAAPVLGYGLQQFIDTRNTPTDTQGWWFGVDENSDNEIDFTACSSGGSTNAMGNPGLVDGNWHTWGLSLSSSLTASFYCDGSAVGTQSVPSFPAANPAGAKAIGARADGAAHWCKGPMGWLGVWNRALSTIDHIALAANPWQVFQPPRGQSLFRASSSTTVLLPYPPTYRPANRQYWS